MKDVTECHARLRGIFNITVTPLPADGACHDAGLARNTERVVGLGFDGILIGRTYANFWRCRSTSESVCFGASWTSWATGFRSCCVVPIPMSASSANRRRLPMNSAACRR